MHFNCVERLLTLASVNTGWGSISGYAYLTSVLAFITSSPVGLKICATTGEVKKYEKIIEKKEEKIWYNSIVRKSQVRYYQSLSSKVLIDSCINHQNFVSVYNMSREYNEIKKMKLMKK